ncbi:uncharacterized protein LOC142574662 [Dermacentor variabilis]|uniref:uncharacterized protein LOC142574662 n=1 Tax=Dermacentor variabilis TaxID=34621 RepID=UPI003F5BF48B
MANVDSRCTQSQDEGADAPAPTESPRRASSLYSLRSFSTALDDYQECRSLSHLGILMPIYLIPLLFLGIKIGGSLYCLFLPLLLWAFNSLPKPGAALIHLVTVPLMGLMEAEQVARQYLTVDALILALVFFLVVVVDRWSELTLCLANSICERFGLRRGKLFVVACLCSFACASLLSGIVVSTTLLYLLDRVLSTIFKENIDRPPELFRGGSQLGSQQDSSSGRSMNPSDKMLFDRLTQVVLTMEKPENTKGGFARTQRGTGGNGDKTGTTTGPETGHGSSGAPATDDAPQVQEKTAPRRRFSLWRQLSSTRPSIDSQEHMQVLTTVPGTFSEIQPTGEHSIADGSVKPAGAATSKFGSSSAENDSPASFVQASQAPCEPGLVRMDIADKRGSTNPTTPFTTVKQERSKKLSSAGLPKAKYDVGMHPVNKLDQMVDQPREKPTYETASRERRDESDTVATVITTNTQEDAAKRRKSKTRGAKSVKKIESSERSYMDNSTVRKKRKRSRKESKDSAASPSHRYNLRPTTTACKPPERPQGVIVPWCEEQPEKKGSGGDRATNEVRSHGFQTLETMLTEKDHHINVNGLDRPPCAGAAEATQQLDDGRSNDASLTVPNADVVNEEPPTQTDAGKTEKAVTSHIKSKRTDAELPQCLPEAPTALAHLKEMAATGSRQRRRSTVPRTSSSMAVLRRASSADFGDTRYVANRPVDAHPGVAQSRLQTTCSRTSRRSTGSMATILDTDVREQSRQTITLRRTSRLRSFGAEETLSRSADYRPSMFGSQIAAQFMTAVRKRKVRSVRTDVHNAFLLGPSLMTVLGNICSFHEGGNQSALRVACHVVQETSQPPVNTFMWAIVTLPGAVLALVTCTTVIWLLYVRPHEPPSLSPENVAVIRSAQERSAVRGKSKGVEFACATYLAIITLSYAPSLVLGLEQRMAVVGALASMMLATSVLTSCIRAAFEFLRHVWETLPWGILILLGATQAASRLLQTHGIPNEVFESVSVVSWEERSVLEVQAMLAFAASVLAETTDKQVIVDIMAPMVLSIAELKQMYPAYYAIPVIVGASSNFIMPASVPLAILHELSRVSFWKLFLLGMFAKIVVMSMVIVAVNVVERAGFLGGQTPAQ